MNHRGLETFTTKTEKAQVKVYRNINEIAARKPERTVVTVGTFDGVHVGHQRVINQLVREAKSIDGESVVITFDPHPRTVVQPGFDLRLIISMDEKIRLLEKLSVDHFVIVHFTLELARTSSHDFLTNYILTPLQPKKIILGYDHHFGKNREGGIEFLNEMSREHDFEVRQIGMQDVKDVAVSSSKIREAIRRGDMKQARELLGYYYSLTGTVVKGNQIGRHLGFPTANIQLDEPRKIIPKYGVYATLIEIDGKYHKGMSNIGIRPTLDLHQLTVEVNIFDFAEDIYGRKITLYFLEHTREEKKFRDLDLLRRRLIIDQIKVKKILGENSENGAGEPPL